MCGFRTLDEWVKDQFQENLEKNKLRRPYKVTPLRERKKILFL